ncbi:MAG: hypothetical protein JST73_05645 [Actinobacteria bacterium]|nr:hypothetical protein [Actinomycetota bacterium]
MSPIRKPPPFNGRTLVIAAAAIVVGVVVLWLASAALTARHNGRTTGVSTGGIVELGNASKLAAQLERGGGAPLYFPDVSGNDRRAVYVTHSGQRTSEGWHAFLAQVPGEPPSCQWQWNARTRRFDASCDPARHAGASGLGLEQYAIDVVRGRLHLDLRAPLESGTATTTPPTGSPTTS